MLLRIRRQGTSTALGFSLRLPRALPGIMTGLVAALFCLVLGVLIGLMLTYASARHWHGVGATPVGAWSLSPADGTPSINPYQRAHFAITGEIPMAASQGLSLVAYHDDAGRTLDTACTYRVSGPVPQARFYTLGVVDRRGRPIANPAGRHAFTSSELLRDDEGHFQLVVSPDASPGNWLPLTGKGSFVLVLRLYDTAVTALGSREIRGIQVPSITANSCR